MMKNTEQYYYDNRDEVDWFHVCRFERFSESFILKMKDYVDWDRVSRHQRLSEQFIKDMKDYVNWDCICEYQCLSESFIREMKDYIDWINVAKYQRSILSNAFIREFKKELTYQYRIGASGVYGELHTVEPKLHDE